jgi:hypothetical protein
MRLKTRWFWCAVLLVTSGCGGDSGGGRWPTPPPTAGNVASVVVDMGPAAAGGVVNTAYVSLTICVPGTTNCQTIDHVILDTASSGFRVFSSEVASSLTLPPVLDSTGQPLAECIAFADGYSWGSVRRADISIAGEQASSVPIQVIGDPAFPDVPADCSSAGPAEDTVAAFGGNGILGVSVFQEDCGPACAATAIAGVYYSCPVSGCVATAATLAQQIQNPVFHFATNNNGVILLLPSIGSAGAPSVTGSLIFGIDTQNNNALGTATVLTVDANSGYLTSLYNGQSLTNSFIDSGSNGFFFPDDTIPVCTSATSSGFYCPETEQTLTATIQSVTMVTKDVPFYIGNADALLNNNPTFFAYDNLGGPMPASLSGSFDFGLPFFYGRTVFFAIEGHPTSAGTGPFVAF